ncbi:hypothetical protein C5E11_04035 [Clavibacter michiganensis]|nr:hypothetical protein [Clavibacter michiganensis]PPF64567.1 hypothetical protein C5E11_04035 [Clavibacter michiganensis]
MTDPATAGTTCAFCGEAFDDIWSVRYQLRNRHGVPLNLYCCDRCYPTALVGGYRPTVDAIQPAHLNQAWKPGPRTVLTALIVAGIVLAALILITALGTR